MGYNGRHSDLDLISFLYRSYSTLKSEYVMLKQEHTEEKEHLLRHNESELIDTLKDLRTYCDVLLKDRTQLVERIKLLEEANQNVNKGAHEQSPEDSLTSGGESETSLPPKNANDPNLMSVLTNELAQMRMALNESLSSAVEIKHLGEMVKQHTRELETV
uniref:GRIP domain-containing protein n=1 Tax=Steinernema glaseri TaxID=37863 RepID=A0A1I7ZTS2_9BILA